MKLTAKEIMRYGAETEREETLIRHIEHTLEPEIANSDEREEDISNLEDRVERLEGFIEEVLSNFESMDSDEFSGFMKECLTDNPL